MFSHKNRQQKAAFFEHNPVFEHPNSKVELSLFGIHVPIPASLYSNPYIPV